VSYNYRPRGYGFGASAASITRRLLAPSPSSGGGRMSLVTNCGLPHAAPVAAAKVRPSSTQVGQAIMLASVRFRRMSMTRLTPNARSSAAAARLAATTDSKASSRGDSFLPQTFSFHICTRIPFVAECVAGVRATNLNLWIICRRLHRSVPRSAVANRRHRVCRRLQRKSA
jgi:hypothetical protein